MRKNPFAFKASLHGFAYALGTASRAEGVTAARWLDGAERKLVRGYLSEKRKLNFLLGRVAAKRGAAALGSKPRPTSLSLLPGVYGQPVWKTLPWETSITHSGPLAFAVSTAAGLPMTIDLESLDEASVKRGQALMKRLSPAEKKLLPRHPAAFLCLWSAKECLGKWLRTGISVAPSVLEISAVHSAGACREIHFKSFPQVKVTQWELGGWLFSLLTPKESAVPGELVTWLAQHLL